MGGLDLHLQWEVTPANAHRFAESIAVSAWKISGLALDFSPASIERVDSIIEQLRAEGSRSDEIGETLFAFGCYVGEVFVRNDGASWRMTLDGEIEDGGYPQLVLSLPNGTRLDPVGKVFKRFESEMDDLSYYYRVLRPPPEGVSHLVPAQALAPDARRRQRWWRRR